MPLEFVKSQKGKDLLVINGEFYRQNSRNGNKIYWLCTKEKSHNCRARCITKDDKCISTGGKHSHNDIKADEVEVCKLLQIIKNELNDTAEPPSQRMATATHQNRNCCHCSNPTHLIGSKYLSETLNVVLPDKLDASKPSILEALILIFGFKLPISEILMKGDSIEYLSDGYSLSSLCICINCESVLKNLYKLFTLFTELSNGKESFILKNSIISGRIKQNKVPSSPIAKTKSPVSLNSITKELSSEVVAEVFISKSVSISAVPPTPGAITNSSPILSSKLAALPNPLPPAKIVEVITIDEDDNGTDSQTSNSLPSSKSVVNTSPNVRKRPASETINLPDAGKRKITGPLPPPVSFNVNPLPNGTLTPRSKGTPINGSGPRSSPNTNLANRSHKPQLPPNNVLPMQPRTAEPSPSQFRHSASIPYARKFQYQTCQECGRQFTSPALLQTHMRYHNSNCSEFKCDYPGCTSTYYESRLLRRHQTMRNHNTTTSKNVQNPSTSRPRRSSGSGDEMNYWKSGVEVLNDPENIMRKAVQGS